MNETSTKTTRRPATVARWSGHRSGSPKPVPPGGWARTSAPWRQWGIGVSCCGMFLLGCAKSDRVATYPAAGEVVHQDGTPLPAGTILLESTEHPLTARGTIEQGKFSLGTYETTDGAVGGSHRVAIIPAPPADYDPDGQQPLHTIDPKFQQFDTSGLTADIPEGGSQDLRFTVQ